MPGEDLLLGGIQGMAGNIGAGASGLLSGITGLLQKKQGNSLLKQNPFPTESIPAEVLANQQIAQNAANEGMPSEQYQAALKNIQRNQAAALTAAQDRRTGSALAGAIQQQANDATGNLDAESAAIRRQNVSQLINVNNNVASWRDKLFDWNQRQKYLQNREYAMGLIGAGNANLYAGIDKVMGAAVNTAAMSGGGSGGKGFADLSTPRDTYNPGLANTSSGAGSPAAGISYIDPNSVPSLI